MYGQTNGIQEKPVATQATMPISDDKGVMSAVHNNYVVKYGDIKVATLAFAFSPSTTASLQSWTTIFELPSGYEATNVSEMALVRVDGNSQSSVRVTGNTLQIVLRAKPSSNYVVYAQLIYV